MNLTEAYAISGGEHRKISSATSVLTLDEAIGQYVLDEVFFGRKPVQKIQNAMDIVYAKVMQNPNMNLNGTPESIALEKAFEDVFGFQKVTIYWANRPDIGTGPYTVPQAKWIGSNDPGFQYGQNDKGFYDAKHTHRMAICTDQALFTIFGLTSEEMVAILLHETGHNFDYSMFTVVGAWMELINEIVNVMTNPTPQQVSAAMRTGAEYALIQLVGPEVFVGLYNLDDMVLNIVPPIGQIVRSLKGVKFNIMKMLNLLLSPVLLLRLPMIVAMTPFNWLRNLHARKMEVYADSFCAIYGYSAEQVTALEKIGKAASTGVFGDETFLVPFYDLYLFEVQIISDLMDGHGSNQRRAMQMADTLQENLERSDLSAADRKAIQAEKDRLMKTYEAAMAMDGDRRYVLTNGLRSMLNNWYAGKNYMIIPNMGRNMQYAK